MSLMRFGALLATPDGRLAFYLSHRVFLTVLKGQGIRAISPADFSPCQVFARNAIAVSLFEAMMARTHSSQTLRSSIDLIRPELLQRLRLQLHRLPQPRLRKTRRKKKRAAWQGSVPCSAETPFFYNENASGIFTHSARINDVH